MKRWIRPLIFLRIEVSLQVTVKLYGLLRHGFDTYDHARGLEIDLEKNASINDLLAHLNLHPDRLGMIYMDGKMLNKNSRLQDGAEIKIFQPIAGG